MEDIQKQVEELNETPKPLTEADIRNQVIEKFGLDEDDNSDLIDKLVEDKIVEQKKFSTAITQKINWRTKAQDLEKATPAPKLEVEKTTITKDNVFDENKVIEVLEKRDLESLDLSDELKKEIQTFAKVQNISIKKALNSDYILFRKEQEEKNEKINKASIGSNRKSTKKDYGTMKSTDFDLRTPEGKAEHAKYQEYLREQLG